MNVLVVGGTGATGSLLVKFLLEQGHKVKAIVRSREKLQDLEGDLELIETSLLDISEEELKNLVNGVDAVVSCLGHNLTFKGIYGKPRKLVRDAIMNLAKAIEHNTPKQPVRLVLMNTTGHRNKDLNEKVSIAHKVVLGLVRVLVPPQSDNEQAAEFLRLDIGKDNPYIEWVAVRPDGLINEDKVTEYVIHESPIRDAIFNAGKVSRINVAHFMSEFVIDNELWNNWKARMPVIYSVNS